MVQVYESILLQAIHQLFSYKDRGNESWPIHTHEQLKCKKEKEDFIYAIYQLVHCQCQVDPHFSHPPRFTSYATKVLKSLLYISQPNKLLIFVNFNHACPPFAIIVNLFTVKLLLRGSFEATSLSCLETTFKQDVIGFRV